MEGILNKSIPDKTRIIIFDLIALSVIYLIPTISHIVGFPIYYLDPMRLMVFLIIIHTNKKNAYIIAGTLPLVSFLTSSHPVLLKSLAMSVELVINVWLFYRLSDFFKNNFISAALSIVLAKGLYYAVKYFLISMSLISSGIIATPLLYQIIVILIISAYVFIIIPKNKSQITD
jgi:hypothetical protein